MNVLVIDIGSSGMRGILFNKKGEIITSRHFKYSAEYGENGIVRMDALVWKEALLNISKSIMIAAEKKGEYVDGIAVTAQRSSVFPVDEKGNPLMKAMMWQDTRNLNICIELEPYKETILALSGAGINPVFSGSKMTWIRRNAPYIYKNTYKFVTPAEYAVYLMTGGFYTDYTYGSRSHLMNIRTFEWDIELLTIFEVEEEKLCKLIPPGRMIGRTLRTFQEASGIPEGIPVISAGGDQQCAAVGQGVFHSGTLSIVAGTGGFLLAAADKVPEKLEGDIICNCSSVEGKYILEANVLTCSSAFDWFIRNFYDGKCDYERVNRELETVQESIGKCMVLPFFQGRGTPDFNREVQAVFAGITLHTNRTDMLKSLLEGIFMEINNCLLLLQSYVDIQQIYISGGLTKSSAANKMQADIYGRKLIHRKDSEATAYGALLSALMELKEYQDLEEAFVCVRRAGTMSPDGETGDSKEAEIYLPDRIKHYKYQEKQEAMNSLYQLMTGGLLR